MKIRKKIRSKSGKICGLFRLRLLLLYKRAGDKDSSDLLQRFWNNKTLELLGFLTLILELFGKALLFQGALFKVTY